MQRLKLVAMVTRYPRRRPSISRERRYLSAFQRHSVCSGLTQVLTSMSGFRGPPVSSSPEQYQDRGDDDHCDPADRSADDGRDFGFMLIQRVGIRYGGRARCGITVHARDADGNSGGSGDDAHNGGSGGRARH